MDHKEQIVIVGAGGFGREVYHWTKAAYERREHEIKGFLAKDDADLLSFGIDATVLGDETNYRVHETDRMIMAIGDIDIKVRVVARLKELGARFATLVHPTAQVASSAAIGEGVVICPFALVAANATIGDFVTLNFYSSCGHDARVGSYSVLSPHAALSGAAEIGEKVFMGTHSTVVPSRKVGSRSKISANSVAMKDVPAGSFVFGVPGKSQTIFTPDDGA